MISPLNSLKQTADTAQNLNQSALALLNCKIKFFLSIFKQNKKFKLKKNLYFFNLYIKSP